MNDLFGNPVVSPRASRQKKTSQPIAPRLPIEPDSQTALNSRVSALWKTHNFTPQVNQLVHFNAGIGIDLTTKKRVIMPRIFGYILVINAETNQVLIHLPRALNSKLGNEEYYICPVGDLLPIESVSEFDLVAYLSKRPPVACPIEVRW